MTISTTDTRISYNGDDSTVAFAVPFKFLAPGDLVVLLRNVSAGTDVVQVLDTNYSVVGEGSSSGGTVTFIVEDEEPATGEQVIIYNNPALTQTVDLVSGDAMPAETLERSLDVAVLQQQRTRNLVERTPRLLEGDTDGSGTYNANSNRIANLLDPTANNDATSKQWVESLVNTTVGPLPTEDAYLTATGSVTSRKLADRWGEVYNVKDYGAVGNGVADDTAAIQAAIDAAVLVVDGAQGGIVLVPKGTFLVNSQIIVKQKVRLIGLGRDSSTIKAGPLFPTSTALIVLGDVDPATHGCSVEHIEVDCNDIAGSTGVYSDNINELSGVFSCFVTKFKSMGIHIEDTAGGTPQNYTLRELEITISSSAGASAIAIKAEGDRVKIYDVTVASVGLVDQNATGIVVDNFSGIISSIHVEQVNVGVLIGNTVACQEITVMDVEGHSTVDDVVKIGSSTTNQNITLIGISEGGATNAINDLSHSYTLPTGGAAGVGFYCIGNGTPVTVLSSDMSVPSYLGRLYTGGTGLGSGDVAFSAAWGSSAAENLSSSSQDSRGRYSVTANGSGITANPTVTITFADLAFPSSLPFIQVSRGDTRAPAGGYWAVTTRATTSFTATFVGTPVAGSAYTLDWITFG